MDVLNFGAHLIGNILMMIYSMICWADFAKIDRKQVLKITTILIFALSIAIISQYFPNPVKMINVFLILMFAWYLLVTKDLKKVHRLFYGQQNVVLQFLFHYLIFKI